MTIIKTNAKLSSFPLLCNSVTYILVLELLIVNNPFVLFKKIMQKKTCKKSKNLKIFSFLFFKRIFYEITDNGKSIGEVRAKND